MGDVVILVPRRADHGRRDRLWSFARARWADAFPSWPIVEGHHDHGPFNRSAAINRAAALAGDWSVAVVIDSDVVPDPEAILDAVDHASNGRPAIGFTHRKHLTRAGTDAILAGDRGSWERYVKTDNTTSVSGAYAVPRKVWDRIAGFDEMFRGWGCEDVAFHAAVELAAGTPTRRSNGTLWHLWHARSPERDKGSALFQANRRRRARYVAALNAGDLDALDRLTTEDLEARVGAPIPVDLPVTTIPRILHRTVPEDTTDEVEAFWQAAQDLHPGWVFLDHRDPLDPADWPETSDLWPQCTTGAQRAGLIRLEALWRWGGVYIDSDVELFRPLDELLGVEGFACWEDARVVPDAVLGFRRGHPAVAVMLERARESIEAGEGAWKSGPGVTTWALPGRADVLLLPPGSFYPYHYTERGRRHEDHRASNPWAFGAHHWAASWVKKNRQP